MKNRILVAIVLQVFLILGSCSGPDSEPAVTPEEKGEIKGDYITEGFTSDFVIGADNTVYTLGQTLDEKGRIYMGVKKIDALGKETTFKYLDFGNFSFGKFTLANNGDLLLVAKSNVPDSDKILRFENNFSDLKTFYTMKPISSPFADKIDLLAISNNNDNTYFVFDYAARNIKRVVPELGTDVFVAGSGKNEIKDGIGLEASFGIVSKIISLHMCSI